MIPDRTESNNQKNIDKYIVGVLNNDENSFADKFSPVREFVKELSPFERATLVDKVRELYASDPYAGIGFTLYGKLHELEKEILKQLESADEQNASLSVIAIKECRMTGAYEILEDFVAKPAGRTNQGIVISTLFSLDSARAMPILLKLLENGKTEDIDQALSNIFYDYIKQEDIQGRRKLRKELILKHPGPVVKAYKDAHQRYTSLYLES